VSTDIAMIPAIGHEEAGRLQAVELQRFIELLRSLSDEDWRRPTECEDWEVRHVALHVLGACEMSASPFETMRQEWRARSYRRRSGGSAEDALTAVQLESRATLTSEQIVARLARAAPRAVKRRGKLVGWFRRHMNVRVDGRVSETVKLGYVVDVMALRDPWMHRIDVCRAVGRAPELTAEHDGRIVADVVADWATRHGLAVSLLLVGPAGGVFHAGTATGETIARDAIDWCRAVSGRGDTAGLLATPVPF
jgi:uncharacterized protein (TIGR03083 family)